MTKAKSIERQQAVDALKEQLRPGDVVYTTLKHVSRSGMMRSINVHLIRDNQPQWIARRVATAIDFSFDDKRGSIKVQGCGMDIGFEVVYNLGRVLFPNGFGEKCSECDQRPTSPEHAKAVRVVGSVGHHVHACKFRGRNGDPSGWDNDGGYALQQCWM
jgi:hypothetical protein